MTNAEWLSFSNQQHLYVQNNPKSSNIKSLVHLKYNLNTHRKIYMPQRASSRNKFSDLFSLSTLFDWIFPAEMNFHVLLLLTKRIISCTAKLTEKLGGWNNVLHLKKTNRAKMLDHGFLA